MGRLTADPNLKQKKQKQGKHMRVAVSRNVLEFDTIHGPGWQCVVGSSFGCYFTHSKGSFIYFRLESLRFLIFKGAAA